MVQLEPLHYTLGYITKRLNLFEYLLCPMIMTNFEQNKTPFNCVQI